MRPLFFVNMRLIAGGEGGLSLPVLANQAFRILHGVFRSHSGEYSLALPKCKPGKGSSVGDVLRVFASSEKQLSELISNIGGHHFIRDYCALGNIQKVPVDYAGPWVQFRRFRPSNKNAGHHTEESTLREKRMAFAADRKLPFFIVASHSNRQTFSLFVLVEDAEQGANNDAKPDSYGLSVSSRPFSLPAIPFSG